jgi:hypothetical protein
MAVAVAQRGQLTGIRASQSRLVDHHQAHWAALGDGGAVPERTGQSRRTHRIVPGLPKRRPEQGAGPLLRHHQQDARRGGRHAAQWGGDRLTRNT